MPNWVTNNVKIRAKKDVLAQIMKDVKSEEMEFDFNNIVPMPESLELESGSITDQSIYYSYLQKSGKEKEKMEKLMKETEVFFYGNYWEKLIKVPTTDYEKQIKEIAEEFKPDEFHQKLGIKTFADLGDMYLHNIKEYGANNWYDWRYDHWGTKWNVDEGNLYLSYEKNDIEADIWFETAWSCPFQIFSALTDKYDCEVEVKFCDEDYGSDNKGHFTMEKDYVIAHDYEDLELAAHLLGDFVYGNEDDYEIEEKIAPVSTPVTKETKKDSKPKKKDKSEDMEM